MRYRLRSLFVAMTLLAVAVAALAAFYNWIGNLYYIQVRTVDSVLAEFPEIDRVWFCTNDDVTLEVEHIYFTIAGQPNTTFEIGSTDGDSKAQLRQKFNHAIREGAPVKVPAWAMEHER